MKSFCLAFIFTLCISANNIAPWGKDADLAYPQKQSECPSRKIETPIFGSLGETLIHFHQSTISPCDGPRSHYFPSSSQYTLEAMRKYGFFRGFIMGCDRLMRENREDWVYRSIDMGNGNIMKWDPVP